MRQLKVMIVGDREVEKTKLLMAYNDYIWLLPQPTEFDIYSATKLVRGKQFHLNFFDPSGTEEYTRLRPLNYPGTNVFLVCFSVVSPSSYENVRNTWVPEIIEHCPNTPFLLVGTRTDRRDDPRFLEELAKHKQRPLQPEDGKKLARELGAVKYMECSAKTKEGVDEVFREAIIAVLEEEKPRMSAPRSRFAGCFMCINPRVSEPDANL